jgi:trehalose/maltose hydrolase-like predicted phosphorylase
VPTAADVYAVAGTNKVPEVAAVGFTDVALAANIPAGFVTVAGGATAVVFAVQAVVTSLNSTNVTADALAALHRGLVASTQLLAAHEAAWAARSAAGGVEVAGDLQLAQALNASLYFIRSSIRADYPHGLSPGGLASDGYGGHTFWDQETWMWPPLLLLDLDCAASALEYRFNRMGAAQNKSSACNVTTDPTATEPYGTAYCQPGYQPPPGGLLFPWESAVTGIDVQTTHGACGPWCRLEQHVSGDIAFAVQQYWHATADREWLRKVGWPLVSGIANFYAARVEPAGGGLPNRTEYHYNGVMG